MQLATSDHRDVILIPAHNRRDMTIGVLRELSRDGVFQWASVLLIDDGSSDGTGETAHAEFPFVHQLRGDGSWWWCGAVRRGMEWALARGAERIFWLNDDCHPPPGALAALRHLVRRDGCVGWIDAVAANGWSYGGHRKTWMRVRRCTVAEEAAGRIDTFSGNCVCLPRHWIERVGLPHDHLFPHGLGDLDYGLRMRQAGATLQPLAGIVAASADPARASAESWLATDRTMREIWRDFRSPRSFLHFPPWRSFALRHWGFCWGWVVFCAPYLRWAAIAVVRCVFPRKARGGGGRPKRDINSPSSQAANRG